MYRFSLVISAADAESCCDALFHECRRTIFLKRKKVTCTRFRQHQTCPGPGRRSPGTSRSNRQLSAGRAWRDPHCRQVRVSCCQSHVFSLSIPSYAFTSSQIGRASGRERVCQLRVDLGGRRNIKKKKKTEQY